MTQVFKVMKKGLKSRTKLILESYLEAAIRGVR